MSTSNMTRKEDTEMVSRTVARYALVVLVLALVVIALLACTETITTYRLCPDAQIDTTGGDSTLVVGECETWDGDVE